MNEPKLGDFTNYIDYCLACSMAGVEPVPNPKCKPELLVPVPKSVRIKRLLTKIENILDED
jgi:hypothetical protein